MTKESLPRILPFAIFMSFIGLEELLRFLGGQGFINLTPDHLHYLYPVKALATGATIIYFWPRYHEFKLRDLGVVRPFLTSLAIGLTVFALWINMEWFVGTSGTPTGFNPTTFHNSLVRTAMTITRLFGAVIIVPVMEEIFWRSFLIRYVINPEFEKVSIGTFTWPSFLITTLLFGLEHNLFLAGVMAGVAYNLLLYRTRSIALCTFAHAITNLTLGIYVLATGKWQFW